jgi:hypothetical protein
MQHFTRRETVILTRTSTARLTYLAKTGIVVPINREADNTALKSLLHLGANLRVASHSTFATTGVIADDSQGLSLLGRCSELRRVCMISIW